MQRLNLFVDGVSNVFFCGEYRIVSRHIPTWATSLEITFLSRKFRGIIYNESRRYIILPEKDILIWKNENPYSGFNAVKIKFDCVRK